MKNSLYVSLCLLNFLHVNNANDSLHMNYAEQVNLDREQRGGLGGWERGAEGKQQLYGGWASFGVMKCLGTRERWRLYNIVNVLNATDVFPLK